jgi:hypothetical protein
MAKEKEEKEVPAVVKNDTDPVKLRCSKVSGPGSEGVKELTFQFGGVAYVLPVGGEMKVTMPRVGADFIMARAKRHWTLQADLSILEPSFR